MHGHDNDDDDDDDPSDPSMSLATVRSHIEGVLQFLDQGPRDISNSNQLYPMMREALSDIIEKQLSCTRLLSPRFFGLEHLHPLSLLALHLHWMLRQRPLPPHLVAPLSCHQLPHPPCLPMIWTVKMKEQWMTLPSDSTTNSCHPLFSHLFLMVSTR